MSVLMKRHKGERGSAVLEFAMVTPVLLLVFAGIAESGLLFRDYETVVNAAREGARLAALPPNEQNDYATVKARVNAYLVQERITKAGDATPPIVTITTESIVIAPGLTAKGVKVTVAATYHFAFLGRVIIGLMNGTFADTATYRASALMRTQVAAVGS
jgi:Flp pilus assembly protein TadG